MWQIHETHSRDYIMRSYRYIQQLDQFEHVVNVYRMSTVTNDCSYHNHLAACHEKQACNLQIKAFCSRGCILIIIFLMSSHLNTKHQSNGEYGDDEQCFASALVDVGAGVAISVVTHSRVSRY